MRLADLTQRSTRWLQTGGPREDVVISSRARLARNLAGMPFLTKCTPSQQAELEQRLREHVVDPAVLGQGFYVDLAAAGDLDRHLLVERHLISRHHADNDCPRGVAVSSDETVAIMINEEDHIRMQALRNGLQLEDAVAQLNRIDDALEQRLDWAFHSRFGYLTACPTNVGTGLRISVMLHLPALKMTGEIEKVFRAAGVMGLALRGLYGEGTEAKGDFFQLSNQTTLGKSEQQIVEDFTGQVLPGFIDYEHQARQALTSGPQRAGLEDKICRAMALLQSAKMISSDEMMYWLSLVRLGVTTGQIADVDIDTLNELFLLGQPAHLQRILKSTMDRRERDEARAAFIQERLGSR